MATRTLLRGWPLWLALVLLPCANEVDSAPQAFHADDSSLNRYLRGLRNRQLFPLAEGECLRRLGRRDLTVAAETQVRLELAWTYAEHAQTTSGGEQAQLWERAQAALKELREKLPKNDDAILRVDLLAIEIDMLRGDLLRWQVELAPYDDVARMSAISHFVEATRDLRALSETVAEATRRSGRANQRKTSGSVLPHELRAIDYRVRFLRGMAALQQARLFDGGSQERLAALNDARDAFGALTEQRTDPRLRWECQIHMVAVIRLQDRIDEAERQLQSIVRRLPPRSLADQIVVERARCLLHRSQPAEVAGMLIEDRRKRGSLTGELHFLHIQSLVQVWSDAEGLSDADRDKLEQQIQLRVRRAASEVGGLWSARCRGIYEFARDSRKLGGELAKQVRVAQTLYRDGKIAECVKAYADATKQASQANQDELAIELAYTRASILCNEKEWMDAADAFQGVVTLGPVHPKAGAASLMRAYCLGRTYAERRTNAARLTYRESLDEHRSKFAEDATYGEATWMLSRLEEETAPRQALRLYEQIPDDHQRKSAARVAVARCYLSIIDDLRRRKQPSTEWEDAALVRIRQMIPPLSEADPLLTSDLCEVALIGARLHLRRDPPEYVAADRLLAGVWRSASSNLKQAGDDAPKIWSVLRRSSGQLRIVSLSARRQLRSASMLIDELAGSEVGEVVAVLDGLAQLVRDGDAGVRQQVGTLQLTVIDRLDDGSDELSEGQLRKLQLCRAEAYAATGQPRSAVKSYRQLLSRSPRNKDLILACATQLMATRTTKDYSSALTMWRKLEGLERQGTRAWLNARSQVIRCLLQTGQRPAAVKLLKVTRLLYPDLGGGELKERFTALQKDAQRR